MANKCTCCGACRCIGCMQITIDAVTAVDVSCQTAVEASYQGRFTAWSKSLETRSPFDLFASVPSECTSDESEYPGTKCTFVAQVCCNPSPEDDIPTGPTDPIDPPPPPPPPPPP